jgi:hypothetical protein
MRRVIGIAVLTIAVIATVALVATGNLVSERVVYTASGGTAASGWQLTGVQIELNWWMAVPLALCFLIGLLCAVLPPLGPRGQHESRPNDSFS